MNQLPQNPDFPKLEEEISEFWEKNQIRQRYLTKNATAKKRFSFLDGPITANNPMGVHHGWGRTYKDLFGRYFTMRGYAQRYQNGFDAQGLWVEVEVEKELGFKTKKDIERYGIDRFVVKCKERVLKYSAIQTDQSKRLGYFMDWEHSYTTMSEENNYSIWHFLKKCFEKDLIYKGRDSVPWCPRCGTAISQHEILTEEYKELTHTALFIAYPVKGKKNSYLLVWTTTPWTLPGNVAVAVGKDIEYVEVTYNGNKYIVAKDRLAAIPHLSGQPIRSIGSGKNIVGWEYEGLFDQLDGVGQAMNGHSHRVVSADLVTLDEGTGLVHIAPGAGSEDFALAKEQNLPVIDLIEEDARYREIFGELAGQNAAANPQIIFALLDKRKSLLAKQPYTHRYPTCWRCKSALVFRIVDEWYIKMDPIRDDIIAIAKQIKWLPAWGLDRELDWLANMRDWLISKKRYWGLSLPIYECQSCGRFEVIGSRRELKARAVSGWEAFEGHTPHRPWVDEVKIKCQCGEIISRILDVGNPWLDAGIVPFSTITEIGRPGVSYLDDPEKKYWRDWFPADFITESLPGQFRNWFYSLLAMSTVLENRPPFKTLLGYGLVRDEHGEEMHKSKGNSIEFNEAASKVGADIMRWLYVTANPQANLNFGYTVALQIKKRFFLIWWNVVNYYLTYARLNNFSPVQTETAQLSTDVTDQWIISRLNEVIQNVSESLNRFDALAASRSLEYFVVEDVSKWYVRRNRKRTDQEFFQTLYHVIKKCLIVLAPFLPYTAEYLYQMLKTESDVISIHLNDWPSVLPKVIKPDLSRQMMMVREIVSLALSERAAKGLKLRQPLARMEIKMKDFLPKSLIEIIAQEVNVRRLTVNSVKKMTDISIKLDTKLTKGLIELGLVREISREIQELRREAGYQVGDSVVIYWQSKSDLAKKLLAKHTRELSKNLRINFFESAADFGSLVQSKVVYDLIFAAKKSKSR